MIAIGCDHGGYELKEKVVAYLKEHNYEVKDCGCYSTESVDYPTFGKAAAQAVANGECEKGIVICTTGIGISISANKVKGIRACCCSDYFSAKYTRMHNDANCLCMGDRVIGEGTALELVDVFINTEFEGGRHQTRVDQIMAIEKGEKLY